jgi:hypothetical protein
MSVALIVFAQADNRQLTASEQTLVDGSKQAILETGISEPYFKTHFKLLNVIDKPSDRRVVWQFSINQYPALTPFSIDYSFYRSFCRCLGVCGSTFGSCSAFSKLVTSVSSLASRHCRS